MIKEIFIHLCYILYFSQGQNIIETHGIISSDTTLGNLVSTNLSEHGLELAVSQNTSKIIGQKAVEESTHVLHTEMNQLETAKHGVTPAQTSKALSQNQTTLARV